MLVGSTELGGGSTSWEFLEMAKCYALGWVWGGQLCRSTSIAEEMDRALREAAHSRLQLKE